jgi:PhoPQ-activated pathogenicity-related protein
VQEVNRTNISDDFEITENKAVLKLKNGTIEKYNLKDPAERSAFEKKYGKIISARTNTSVDASTVAVITGSSGQTVIVPVTPVVATDDGRALIVDDNGNVITGKEDILVTITRNTTANQLGEFKKQMKEKAIELEFNNIDYNDGILVNISGTMKSKDGQSNFVATDFNKLILSTIRKDDRTYFKVSVTDNKKVVI